MDIPYPEFAGIIVSLILSAFFSGSETALTALSYVKVDQIMEAHPQWGRVLLPWKHHHGRILTTILIGNNLVNVTASALATEISAYYFASNSVPIAIGVMTFLLLVSGEITPKTLAKAYSEQLALPLMSLILVFYYLLFPAVWIISVLISAMIHLLGGRLNTREVVTEKDLEFMVNLGGREGTLDRDKQSLLNSIFEFGATVTREIMIPRTDLTALSVDTPYEKVIDITQASGFSRIPIYEDNIDRIIGIFHTKDLINIDRASAEPGFLATNLRPAVFVPESKKISEVLRMFQQDRTHMAIVVDEFGGTAGIVTMEDIIEELLGDIHDEFDVKEDRIVRLQGGALMADARVAIDDLESELRIRFPEERDYESLGGFLMEVAGEVPAAGWQHVFEGYAFQVSEADANRLIRVRIDPIATGEEPAIAVEDPETTPATK